MVVGRRFTRKKKNTWHIIQDYKVIHLQEKTLKTVFHCSFFVCLSPRHTTDQMTRLTHLNISFTSPKSQKPKDNHFRMIYEREKRQMSPHKNMEQEICFFFFYCFGIKKCLKLIILMIRIVAGDICSLYLPYKKISFWQQNLASHLSSFLPADSWCYSTSVHFCCKATSRMLNQCLCAFISKLLGASL